MFFHFWAIDIKTWTDPQMVTNMFNSMLLNNRKGCNAILCIMFGSIVQDRLIHTGYLASEDITQHVL